MLQIHTTIKAMTKNIIVPALELAARIRGIHAGGGVITRMAVAKGFYELTVRWKDQPELSTGADLRTVRSLEESK